ncbi:MAG: hypothetical protein WD904_01955 [Dehalococcoidia bacterium]
MLRTLSACLLLISATLLLACGDDDDDAAATPSPTPAVTASAPAGSPTPTGSLDDYATPAATVDTAVAVTLSDDAITLDVDTVPSGTVTFSITNSGASAHTLVIVETTLAEDALPTTAAGAFDPVAGAATIVAQSPGINAGASDTARVSLATGSYVLISNNDGDYAAGLHAAFTVE